MDNWKDKYLYLAGEFENYKKRNSQLLLREEKELCKKLLQKLLPFVGDLQRAQEYNSEVQVLTNKYLQLLEDFGVSQIPIKPGDQFDSSLMNAVMVVPGTPSNCIKDVVNPGFIWKSGVLKYADVIVYENLD